MTSQDTVSDDLVSGQETLFNELVHQIARVNRQRKRDKRKATWLKMATITLTASVPVLIGLEGVANISSVLINTAFVIGVVVTGIIAYDSFFDHRSLWVMRANTVAKLLTLKIDFDFEAARAPEHLSASSLNALKSRLEAILKDDLESWLSLRRRQATSS